MKKPKHRYFSQPLVTVSHILDSTYFDVVVCQRLVKDGHLVALDGALLEVVVVLHQELLLALEELVDVALRRVQHQLVARLRERGEHAWD